MNNWLDEWVNEWKKLQIHTTSGIPQRCPPCSYQPSQSRERPDGASSRSRQYRRPSAQSSLHPRQPDTRQQDSPGLRPQQAALWHFSILTGRVSPPQAGSSGAHISCIPRSPAASGREWFLAEQDSHSAAVLRAIGRPMSP